MSEDSGASRPRLNLKPRDENAARQLEIQRTASGKVIPLSALQRGSLQETGALRSSKRMVTRSCMQARMLQQHRGAVAALDAHSYSSNCFTGKPVCNGTCLLRNPQNPFGDAKPREAILASRTGKSETEILKEEVKSEKPKVQLPAVHQYMLEPFMSISSSHLMLNSYTPAMPCISSNVCYASSKPISLLLV